MSILDAACQFDQPVTCHPHRYSRQANLFKIRGGKRQKKRKKNEEMEQKDNRKSLLIWTSWVQLSGFFRFGERGGRFAVCYVFLTTWPPYPSLKRNNHHWHIIMILPPVTMGDVQQFMEVHPCSRQQHIFSSGSAEYSNNIWSYTSRSSYLVSQLAETQPQQLIKLLRGKRRNTRKGVHRWSNWYRSNHSFE